jgi:hypothetical protein
MKNQSNYNKNTLRHIKTKLLKVKDEQKILKGRHTIFKGTMRLMTSFSTDRKEVN